MNLGHKHLSKLVLSGALVMGSAVPSSAQQDGWASLARAQKLLVLRVRPLDLKGPWEGPPEKEWEEMYANNRLNQNALLWIRRGLKQPLTGRARGFDTHKHSLSTELARLGYALIQDGRVKFLRGESAAALSAHADAVQLAHAINKPTTGKDTKDLMAMFRQLNRMAGVARVEIFYRAKTLAAHEWKPFYTRWRRLSQQLPSPPKPRSGSQSQSLSESQRAEIQLAQRGLALENEAVDTALWLRQFELRNQRRPHSPAELQAAGWKGLAPDPFSPGARLRWKKVPGPRAQQRILIYSAGPNGRFDNGAPLRNPPGAQIEFDSPVIETVKQKARGDLEVLRFRPSGDSKL